MARALSSGEGGLAGGLSAVGRLLNPAVIGFGLLGGALALSAKLALDYEAAQSRASLALRYLGVTSGATVADVEKIAQATASGAGVSVNAAVDMELAFAKTGKIGSDLFAGLISVQRDYATATGTESAAATEALAKAFADPAKGAADLTDQLHFLNGAQLDQIKSMEEAGDRAGAQRVLMEALQPALAGAADHVQGLDRVLRDLKVGFDDAWAAAGRFIDRVAHGVPIAEHLAQLQRERAGASGAERGLFSEGGDIAAHRVYGGDRPGHRLGSGPGGRSRAHGAAPCSPGQAERRLGQGARSGRETEPQGHAHRRDPRRAEVGALGAR